MSNHFPQFKLDLETIKPTILNYLLKIEQFNEQLKEIENPVYDALKEIDALENEFSKYVSEFFHLMSVNDSDLKLNDIYEDIIPEWSEIHARMSQDKGMLTFYEKLAKTDLTPHQRKAIDNTIKSFKYSGINLEESKQKELNDINQELSMLSNTFSSNVTTSQKELNIFVKDEKRLAGIPEVDKERFKTQSEKEDFYNYVIRTNYPDYLAVMEYSELECLRKEAYSNYYSVASEYTNDGKYDNTEIMKQILKLRQTKAELLGFENFAELSIDKKMAESPKQVVDFLEDLVEKATPQSKEEKETLKKFAETLGLVTEEGELEPWNAAYVDRLYKEQMFDFDENKIKEYFPMEKVQNGLFSVIDSLFNIKVEKVTTDYPKYVDNLELFSLSKEGVVIAYIYGDFYAREGKRDGAWMSDYCSKHEDQVPVAFVNCNFPMPVGEKDSLLSFYEVTTIFHEFGHALHHTLTQIEVPEIAGISGVPWDAVELPSTFMEFFCQKEIVLDKISGHYETGETLPLEIVEKIKQVENYGSGSAIIRQMELSLVDMWIHMNPELDTQETASKFKEKYTGLPYPEKNKRYNQFNHIFSGGYAAGYYSYKWADILASDVFETFEENGVLCEKTGQEYLEKILSKGGSEEILNMFKDFKGREPKPDAFLKYSGIKLTK